MEVLPTQSSVSLRVKAGDAKHHHHVHHHHHEDGKGHDYAHLHSQLQDHVSGGVLKDLCGCVLGEMLVEELEKAKVTELRRQNEEKEAELEKQKRELIERERYYRENAPPQVRAQMAATFGKVIPTQEKEEESRFEELED